MDFTLTDEQNRIIALLDDMGQKEFSHKASKWDEKHEYPWDNVHALKENGILGMTIPAVHGGKGRPLIDAIVAIETAAKYCGITGRIIVETNMGALGVVMAYGDDKQREIVARRILQDGDKPAIAMTEKDAGTALTDLKTRAVKDGDHYILNGVKRWITGGGVSNTNLVFARFIEDGNDAGIGGILVDRDAPGFSIGSVERAMGLRGIPEAEIILEDCKVPVKNVVESESTLRRFCFDKLVIFIAFEYNLWYDFSR